MNLQGVFSSSHTKRKHQRSEDSREVFLSRWRKIETGKESRLTKVATRERCHLPPHRNNKLKREPGRKTMDRLRPEVPNTAQLRKSRSSQARSCQGGPPI
ncbi:hypothetical protein TNCV_881911 [Trichonephila clavipes]|nr:hypothetical protein TNCV_881911 [Trichonephila clavipes]